MEKNDKTDNRQRITKIWNHLWNDNTRQAIRSWAKLVFSFKGIWCFIPPILGVLFVYWAEAYSKPLILKENHEVLAIVLMSIAVALFLTRAFLYRLEIDYILLLMSVNFLMREIHFAGTNDMVVIIAAFVLVWVLYRKEEIWASLDRASVFKICLAGTIITYIFSILVARRVFRIERIPLLPNEAVIYDRLEEVLENIAHMYLILTAMVAFFSISIKKSKQLENKKG